MSFNKGLVTRQDHLFFNCSSVSWQR